MLKARGLLHRQKFENHPGPYLLTPPKHVRNNRQHVFPHLTAEYYKQCLANYPHTILAPLSQGAAAFCYQASLYAAAACILYYAAIFANYVLAPHRYLANTLSKKGYAALAPVAVTYVLLLLFTTRADTASLLLPGDIKEGFSGFRPQFFPTVASFGQVMANAVLSVWVHFMCLNVLVAREIQRDSMRGVPVRHSLLLCSLFAPLAWLVHLATRAIVLRDMRVKTREMGGGQVILTPYSSWDEGQ